MREIPDEQTRFLKDVSKHEMKIIKDDGVYRHIRFSEPGTSCYRFDLHTWPGALCYTGDMGTYVFERTHDMFEFFVTKPEKEDPEIIHINRNYWTEKLVAVDGNRGGGKIKEFSEKKFKAIVNEYRVGWMRDAKNRGFTAEQRRELWEAVDDDVLCHLEDNNDRALHAVHEFYHTFDDGERKKRSYDFQDFFEHIFDEYTHSIVWCLYALSWGVSKYNTEKEKANGQVPDAA